MRIQHTQTAAEIQAPVNKPELKQGQIIQGKVLQLYPNHKALMQLGSQKMVAQLEAALTTGSTYYFQVQATDDVIRLSVLGDKLKNQMPDNVINLLQQLGFKTTKQSKALVELLITEKVPFNKDQLTKALHLVQHAQNQVHARQAVKEMMVRTLPMTKAVFQAMYSKRINGLTEQIRAFIQQVKPDTNANSLQQQIVNHLSNLVNQATTQRDVFVKHAMTEIAQDDRTLFAFAKAKGMLDKSVDFTKWKQAWMIHQERHTFTSSFPLPFNMNDDTLLKMLGQADKQTAKELQQWAGLLRQSLQNNKPLPDAAFTVLKQELNQQLVPKLTNEQIQLFTQYTHNHPESLRNLLSILEAMANVQADPKLESLYSNMKQALPVTWLHPKELFLQQVKQVLQFVGLNYEHQLLQKDQMMTIKSMLIQLLHNSDGSIHEQSQQLLHHINGLQIHSVQESANFIQASMQLPGEKLGLLRDIQLNFEGKKTNTGEISTDYCRILFYLDLAHVKETVIDMNVQKRSIAVTIYNSYSQLNEHISALKPMLKEGLNQLDYHLSTVALKPLKETENKTDGPDESFSAQGVDYRI
ncbi:hypothetical protein WMZ97_02340 [Lentibacillus sp. N15]|uniref:hypothetical protein n=1 Tax=Lentibacillus songyuanensis TaxID=3136161 RepID=UPI0031BA1D09